MKELSSLFNEHECKYACCRRCKSGFIRVGKSSLHFLGVTKHELNSGLLCLCLCKIVQSALILMHVQACNICFPLSLFLVEKDLIYVRAVRKPLVHRDSDCNSQFLIAVSGKKSVQWVLSFDSCCMQWFPACCSPWGLRIFQSSGGTLNCRGICVCVLQRYAQSTLLVTLHYCREGQKLHAGRRARTRASQISYLEWISFYSQLSLLPPSHILSE